MPTQGSVGGFCVVLARPNPDVAKHLEKLGCRSSDTVELTFDEVVVDEAQRVGEVDHGFLDTMQILDRGRVSIAAIALGSATAPATRAKRKT